MNRSHVFTFAATFLFVAAVMIFSSLVAGNEQTAFYWVLFFGLVGLGVGFMSAARYMNGRPSESTSLVPQPVSGNTAAAAASEAPESVDYADDTDEPDAEPQPDENEVDVDADVPPAKRPATDEEQRMEAVNEEDLETTDERRAQASTGETVDDENQTEEEIPVEELTPAPPKNREEELAEEALLSPSDDPDDLTRIEGIGPAMSRALVSQNVDTFAKLADMSLDDIRAALDAAGQRFAPAAESWAEQASYAAKADWDGLDALQDRLVAGRYPDDEE